MPWPSFLLSVLLSSVAVGDRVALVLSGVGACVGVRVIDGAGLGLLPSPVVGGGRTGVGDGFVGRTTGVDGEVFAMTPSIWRR